MKELKCPECKTELIIEAELNNGRKIVLCPECKLKGITDDK